MTSVIRFRAHSNPALPHLNWLYLQRNYFWRFTLTIQVDMNLGDTLQPNIIHIFFCRLLIFWSICITIKLKGKNPHSSLQIFFPSIFSLWCPLPCSPLLQDSQSCSFPTFSLTGDKVIFQMNLLPVFQWGSSTSSFVSLRELLMIWSPASFFVSSFSSILWYLPVLPLRTCRFLHCHALPPSNLLLHSLLENECPLHPPVTGAHL